MEKVCKRLIYTVDKMSMLFMLLKTWLRKQRLAIFKFIFQLYVHNVFICNSYFSQTDDVQGVH